MTPGVPTKVIAACCGLTAFTVAIVAGLAADNPADVILTRALVGMVGCQMLGFIIGTIGERTVVEAATKYRAARPVDFSSTSSPAGANGPSRPAPTAGS